jgi:thiol-disulfide isomerase/thioredoxin
MRQVLGTRFQGAWGLMLAVALAGCSNAGGNESDQAAAGQKPADAAVTESRPPGETPDVKPAPVSDFDKEAAVAEARRRQVEQKPPALSSAPSSDAAPKVDTSQLTTAPAWEAKRLDGTTVTNADFAGKVVILDFWATWCGPCKKEIPHFKELYAEYAAMGLEVVGVDVGEPASRVAPFVQQAQINYHTVLGTQKMVGDYGPINGIPTTFVISQDGKIYRRYVGYRPKQTFEQDVRTLLGMTS